MFSKSQRFDEIKSQAPPVGKYDVQANSLAKGGIALSKSKRFVEPNDVSDGSIVAHASSVEKFSKPRSSVAKSSSKKAVNKVDQKALTSTKRSLDSELECGTSEVLLSLQERVEALQIELDREREHSEEYKRECEKIREKFVHVNDQNFMYDRTKALLENIVSNLISQIDSFDESKRLEISTLSKKIERLNHQVHKVTRVTISKADALHTSELKLKDLQKQVSEYSSKIQELTEENVQFAKDDEKIKEGLDNLLESYTNLQGKYDSETKNYVLQIVELQKEKELQAEAEESMMDVIENMQLSYNSLLEKHNQNINMANEVSCSHEDEKNQLLKKINELECQIEKQVLSYKSMQEKHEIVLENNEKDVELKNEQIKSLREAISRTEKELDEATAKHDLQKEEYENSVSKLNEELALMKEEMAKRIMETQIQHAKTLEESSLNDFSNDKEYIRLQEEMSSWKSKYLELEAKVTPFMDQINAFEMERQYLLNANALTQAEVLNLSNKYSQLLGHQNTKQKIKHIQKLKDENIQLKEEVQKLRKKTGKDKTTIANLERQLGDSKGRTKFDPSKAFQHGNKENERDPLSTVIT